MALGAKKGFFATINRLFFRQFHSFRHARSQRVFFHSGHGGLSRPGQPLPFMNSRLLRFALFSIALSAHGICARAQNSPQNDCPPAASMKAAQLHGRWAARFSHPPAGLPENATVVLERHAEFSESLAGTVSRKLSKAGAALASGHAPQAALAGDLDEGLRCLMNRLTASASLAPGTAKWCRARAAAPTGASGKTPAAAPRRTRLTCRSR